jgi:hypothetical protein
VNGNWTVTFGSGVPEHWPTSETLPEVRESRSVPGAQFEDFGSELTPMTQGWFVVNVRDAEWWFSESRGARCAFESEYGDPPVEFAQFGVNVTVLLGVIPSGVVREHTPTRR